MSEKNRTVPSSEMDRQREYTNQIASENDRFFEANGIRKKAFVLTLGCQQNEADSERLAGMAQAMGSEMSDKPDDAYLIIVNTCAIREHAEKRALSLVGQYKHIKARNTELIIAICGCMVTQQHRSDEIKHRYPYVDIVFGTSSIHKFPELV